MGFLISFSCRMEEETVLFLMGLQFLLICTCLYLVKTYCVVPCGIGKGKSGNFQAKLILFSFSVRRIFRFCCGKENRNQQPDEPKQTATTTETQQPTIQQIPIFIPIQQGQSGQSFYPVLTSKGVGFVLSPSLQTLSSTGTAETNLPEEPQKKCEEKLKDLEV